MSVVDEFRVFLLIEQVLQPRLGDDAVLALVGAYAVRSRLFHAHAVNALTDALCL